MKSIINQVITPSLLLGVFLSFASSCNKEDDDSDVITTTSVTEITVTTAKSGGNILSDGGSAITSRGVCWSTTSSPTVSDNTTTDGSGTGAFTSSITGLSANTTYHVRAYATNSTGTVYGNDVSFTTSQNSGGDSFTDPRDGTVYQTVTIGNQIWMAENLRYLPNVSPATDTSFSVARSYVSGYSGTNVSDAKATTAYQTYGALYNWPGAMTLCPEGWHLPTYAEWAELAAYLGGDGVAGGKLKSTGNIEAGTGLWYYPNTGATNETGFNALPAGYSSYDNNSGGLFGSTTHFWTTESGVNNTAWLRFVTQHMTSLGIVDYHKSVGYSVRCIKD